MAGEFEAEAMHIGGDWMAAIDPSSGATYYVNEVEGVTQWEWPEADLGPEPDGGVVFSEVHDGMEAAAHESPWIDAQDPSSGVTYYINTETQETTWEMPEGFDPAAAAALRAQIEAEEAAEEAAQEGGQGMAHEGAPIVASASDGEVHVLGSGAGQVEEEPASTVRQGLGSASDGAVPGDEQVPSGSVPEVPASSSAPSSVPLHGALGTAQVQGEGSAAVAAEPLDAIGETPAPIVPPPKPPKPPAPQQPSPVLKGEAVPPSPTKPSAPRPPLKQGAVSSSGKPAMDSKPQPPSGSAPFPAGARPMAVGVRHKWVRALSHIKAKARKSISAGAEKAEKFAKLRSFAKLAEKKKIEAAAALAAGKAGADGAASTEPKETILKFTELSEEDAASLATKTMTEYGEAYFNRNRKGIFGSATTVSKMLAWKNSNIRTALKKMPTKDMESAATQCFRNITGYMGDRSSRKDDGGHAEKVIKTCLSSSEEIRDEVYCQLAKQTNQNPDQDSRRKGWQLICICAGCFSPSTTLLPHFVHYCKTAYDDPTCGTLAQRAVRALLKSSKLGPRRETPLPMELNAMASLNPVLMRVYHMDGTYEVLPVCSWTTAGDLNRMMAFQLKLTDASAFSVYEMTPEYEERFLEADERVLDLVAYWQRLHDEEKGAAKAKALSAHHTFRLVYKVRYYFDPAVDDAAAMDEFYRQTVYDIVRMRYPSNLEKCKALAALQLVVEYGPKEACSQPPDIDSGCKTALQRFLPNEHFEELKKAERATLGQELSVAWAGHGSKTKAEAIHEYLSEVRSWEVWGSNFYFVEPQNSTELPVSVFLAVNPTGLLFIDYTTKETVKKFPYSEVPTWGHSGTAIVLHVGSLSDATTTKMYFKTDFGKEINNLIQAYVQRLCDSSAALAR